MADREKGRANTNGCLCFCCVLAVIIIVILCIIIFLSLFVGIKGCDTPECVSVASGLMAPMDRSADPCVDFYEYACGNWDEMMPKHLIGDDMASWKNSFLDQRSIDTKLLKQLEEDDVPTTTAAPTTPRPPGATSAPGTTEAPASSTKRPPSTSIKKAKDFFAACKSGTMDDTKAREAFNRLITLLGSWSLTDGTSGNLNRGTWNLGEALGKAHHYTSRPFFVLRSTAYHRLTKTGSTMEEEYTVHPTMDYRINFEDRGMKEADYNALRAVVGLLGIKSASINLETSATKMWAVQKENTERVERSCRSVEHNEERKMTLSEFNTLLGREFDLVKYWNEASDVPIRLSRNITVRCPAFFQQIGNMASHGKDTLANAIVWSVVKEFADKLRPTFWEQALRDMHRVTGEQVRERWEQCIESTIRNFPGPAGALYADATVTDKDVQKVKDMVKYIEDAAAAGLATAPSNLTKIVKLNQKKVKRVIIDDMFNDTRRMDAEYADYVIGKDDFTNLLNVQEISRSRSMEDKHANRNRPRYSHGHFGMTLDESGTMTIGVINLEKPYFTPDSAGAMNFGALGFRMAREFIYDVTAAVGETNPGVLADNVEKLMDQQRYRIPNREPYQIKDLGFLFYTLGSLRVAHDAYKKWDESHDDTAYMVGLELSNEQVFFLSYAQTQCEAMGDQRAESERRAGKLSPKAELSMTLYNSPEFADAYNCPEKNGTLNYPSAHAKWQPFQFRFSAKSV